MNKSSLCCLFFGGVVCPPQQTQAKLRSMYDSSYHLQQCVGDTSKELMQQSFHADTLHDESFSDLVCRGFSYAFNFQLHARPLGVPLNTSQTFSNSHLAPCIGGFRRPRRFRNSSAQAFDCGPAHALHLSCKHSCAVRGGRCLSNDCYLIAWI